MDKHLKFVLIVQTGAIVSDLQLRRGIASQVVHEVCDIDPNCIPDNVGRAAGQYLSYCYDGACKRPSWLPKPGSNTVDKQPADGA